MSFCSYSSQMLSRIDLLQIFTLPWLYLNPIYTHLAAQPLFALVFTEIYPRLYFFKQETATLYFPVCSAIFMMAMIILIAFRKQKPNICILAAQFVLVLLPLLIFRLASQIVHVFYSDLAIKVVGILIVSVNIITIFVILVKYQKIAKILDLLIGILLFCELNQYALMSLLALKIFLTYLIPISTSTKFMKLTLELSLLISLILLLFVKPVTINYIMLVSLIIVSFMYPTFKFIVGLQYTDITKIKPEEDDVYSSNECYSYNELEFFKRVHRHMSECVNLYCKCREIVNINSLKKLKQWIPSYTKNMLKIAIQGSEIGANKIKPNQIYQKQIEYIKFCVESSQQLDFSGFLRLHKLNPKNSIEQYQKYHYMKEYSLVLQKSNPKALKMNIVKHSQQSSPYNDFMTLQNKISSIVTKIQIFWRQLLKFKTQKSQEFVHLVEQISNEVEEINKLYQEIQLNYDEKQEAEYYYNIFRLLALQQKTNTSIFLQHESNYVIITNGTSIKNITTNITHLVKKSKQHIIDHNFTTLMLPVYASEHPEWIRKYYEGYRIYEEPGFVKSIAITPNTFKVVEMTHMLIPNYSWLQSQESRDNKQNDGVNIATLISLQYSHVEQQNAYRKQIAFHLLVSRENLDIVAFEPAIFDYFFQKETLDNTNKLLRANLKKIFPNLNRQAIIHNKNGRILIAREDPDFFSADQETGNLIDKAINMEVTQQVSRNKSLQISEVPSIQNQQLGLLLLSFQYLIDKEQKIKAIKNSEKDVRQQNLNQTTLKNILEQSAKTQNEKQKDPQQALRKLEVIQSISILLIFGVFAAVFVIFETDHLKLKDFMSYYDKKAQFYTDLSLTQLYYQNFSAGKNRLSDMEEYWSYNQEYTDLMTIFTSISEQAFSQKFKNYIKLFQKRLAFQELSDKIQNINKKFQGVSSITTILFWCSFILIVINFLVSLTIFIKNEMGSIKILSTFLYFNQEEINLNLKRLKKLEKILEIQQFRKNLLESIETDQSKGVQTATENDENYESKYERRKKARRGDSRDKDKLQKALKNHFKNFMNNYEVEDQSTIQIIKKDQSIQNSKNQKTKDVKQDENEEEGSPFSLPNRIYKNLGYMSPTLIGFIFKLSIALILLLFITNLIKSTTICLQFKHQLFSEPVHTLNELQLQYLENKKIKKSLIQYEFNNSLLLKQLPVEFQKFRHFYALLSTTERSLCTYINRTKSEHLYQKCTNCQEDIFLSGIHILIEYIEQKFRQVRIGYIPKQYLLKENYLSLAIEVCLQIEYERNLIYTAELQKFYDKYSDVKNLIRIILICVFLICIYLHIKQFSFAMERKYETQNLLKIVPLFMRNENPNRK